MPESHGQRTTYRRGCRCAPCKSANAEAERQRRRAWLQGKPPMGSLVTASDSLQILASLAREQYSAGYVAALLGLKSRCPRLHTGRITLRNALKVKRLARLYLV